MDRGHRPADDVNPRAPEDPRDVQARDGRTDDPDDLRMFPDAYQPKENRKQRRLRERNERWQAGVDKKRMRRFRQS
jgi:hypothetical protein